MHLTIPAMGIIAAAFLATFAFAPAIASVAEPVSKPAKIELSAQAELQCSPAARIVAALRGTECKA